MMITLYETRLIIILNLFMPSSQTSSFLPQSSEELTLAQLAVIAGTVEAMGADMRLRQSY